MGEDRPFQKMGVDRRRDGGSCRGMGGVCKTRELSMSQSSREGRPKSQEQERLME